MDKTKFSISNEFGQFQYWHDCDDSQRYRGIMKQTECTTDSTRTFECLHCGVIGEVTIDRMQAGYGRFFVKDGE